MLGEKNCQGLVIVVDIERNGGVLMKLAEALADRKTLSDRMTALSMRARRSALAPEGRAGLESVTAILDELDHVLSRWEERVVQINRSNMIVQLDNGMTLMEALARRDCLTRHLAILGELMQAIGGGMNGLAWFRGKWLRWCPLWTWGLCRSALTSYPRSEGLWIWPFKRRGGLTTFKDCKRGCNDGCVHLQHLSMVEPKAFSGLACTG